MNRSRRRRAFAGALVFALLVAFVTGRFDMSTEITHFLPSEEAQTAAAVSRALAESPMSRTMVLSVGASDPERARAAASELARSLSAQPGWAWISHGPELGLGEAFFELVFPHRLGFLSTRP
ncbi:MAG: hypothetical protein QF464_13485, partial [Myxococcota bacterium]|nr:hypothetical protein [Myxococcota bacterium]